MEIDIHNEVYWLYCLPKNSMIGIYVSITGYLCNKNKNIYINFILYRSPMITIKKHLYSIETPYIDYYGDYDGVYNVVSDTKTTGNKNCTFFNLMQYPYVYLTFKSRILTIEISSIDTFIHILIDNLSKATLNSV